MFDVEALFLFLLLIIIIEECDFQGSRIIRDALVCADVNFVPEALRRFVFAALVGELGWSCLTVEEGDGDAVVE